MLLFFFFHGENFGFIFLWYLKDILNDSILSTLELGGCLRSDSPSQHLIDSLFNGKSNIILALLDVFLPRLYSTLYFIKNSIFIRSSDCICEEILLNRIGKRLRQFQLVFSLDLVAIKTGGVYAGCTNSKKESSRNSPFLFQHSELVKNDKESDGRLGCLFVLNNVPQLNRNFKKIENRSIPEGQLVWIVVGFQTSRELSIFVPRLTIRQLTKSFSNARMTPSRQSICLLFYVTENSFD